MQYNLNKSLMLYMKCQDITQIQTDKLKMNAIIPKEITKIIRQGANTKEVR